jgi:3-hydroxyisobutyrate dehydrogenase-like beta-hydroxyacid dehydrogenase
MHLGTIGQGMARHIVGPGSAASLTVRLVARDKAQDWLVGR